MTPRLPLTAHSTLVVLSPHLDDAVLSCGALIADSRQRGTDVIVVTVFNGRPAMPVSAPAARFHARCSLADNNAMDEREREDDRATSTVGARTKRLYLPEALYRKNSGGEPLYGTDLAIFCAEPPASDDCLITVAGRVGAQVDAVGPDLVLAPLGIGGHVDHLLVSQAARRLDRRVLHYEDVPYLLYDRCRGWRDKIRARGASLHICTPDGWSAKISGIECYESQREVLWDSPGTWREDLASYACTIGSGIPAEQYWALDER